MAENVVWGAPGLTNGGSPPDDEAVVTTAPAEEAVSVVAVITPSNGVRDSTELLGSGRIVMAAVPTLDKLRVQPVFRSALFGTECIADFLFGTASAAGWTRHH
jgi:hypothetical protein